MSVLEITDNYQVIEIYKQSPELFAYAKALDEYIDQLEQSNQTLRESCKEMLIDWTPKNGLCEICASSV